MSILVIDGEFESRTLLTEVLSSEGFEVRTTDGSALALVSVGIERPELILLDIQMPGMDGFEICRRLKETVATGDIPVIILSASDQSSDRVKGLRLGAVDSISKPFEKEELLARVRTHLELSRLRVRLEKRAGRHTQERLLKSQRLASLGVMAAGVAHDFGNLLGAIIAKADLALSDLAYGSAGRESVEEIAALAMRASDLARMLMISAGGSSNAEMFGAVNLSSEVEQMLRLLKVSLSKRAVVRTSLTKDLPPVRGIGPQIQQVIMNIVTNASDALADKPGTIIVATDVVHLAGRSANQPFGVSAGDYVRLSVSDTGCGMTAETRARIFDQFFTTKSEGRGLGLAAVHGIVRSHSGAISVQSAPGRGSTFEILFPSMSAAKAMSAARGAAGGF